MTLPEPGNPALARFIPGSFLTAVIRNDMRAALAAGDDESLALLHELVTYINSNLPCGCWGRPGAIEEWKGL